MVCGNRHRARPERQRARCWDRSVANQALQADQGRDLAVLRASGRRRAGGA
jgi:hypothetical protein